MNLKNLINPINWYYFCKGYLKSFIIRQQNEALVTVGNRASICPECWNSPDSCCIECGCQIPEVWLSGKQCSKSK